MSVILKNILKLQKDFVSSENYLTKEEIISLVSKTRSVFNKKTVWNNPDQIDEKKRISSNCLFGFKSGIVFQKNGIYFFQDTQIRSIGFFPFSKQFTIIKGTKELFYGSYHVNQCDGLILDLTVLNIVDKWDFPLKYSVENYEDIPQIFLRQPFVRFPGDFNPGKFLENDEFQFFKILEENLKNQSDKTENSRLNNLKKSHNKILFELDKDGNGEVDVVEGNDFDKLLKKYQKSILKIDRNYIQKFVKISTYLKLKKENIQSIFNSIKYTQDQVELNEYVDILKDEIHMYNLILFNSLNMIVSLVKDDLITFYEIYEIFDNINMFDSKYEKDVSQKLTNIGDGLRGLMFEIRDMGNKISNSIQELSYVTKETTSMLKNSLGEINSSLDTNNLLTMIQTYQTYKINQNTKSLR